MEPQLTNSTLLVDRWRATSLRSTFGKQCTSSIESAPACGFGSAVRDASRKQYVSGDVDRANCKASGGNNSQGAIYKTSGSFGKQALSTMGSAPLPGFGSAKRPSMAVRSVFPGPGAYRTKSSVGDQFESTKSSTPKPRFGTSNREAGEKQYISAEHEKSGFGRMSPGPSAYNLSGGLGKQTRSDRTSLPSWRLGTEKRFSDYAARESANAPGPGQYRQGSAVGQQPMSTKKNLPSIAFGASTRDSSKKMFISVDHEKSNYGECSPGPGTANQGQAIGHQSLSTKESPPTWGFGSSQRSPLGRSETPGPGEYFA
ncbi:hypothetical protein WJX74_004174 [Apatococcus lobatus]|uniref:Flagellar associated protein n=1 Tax=Apatococcus lobatus TaxID=904363 RepID=A0AAW1S2C3_9CHLO